MVMNFLTNFFKSGKYEEALDNFESILVSKPERNEM